MVKEVVKKNKVGEIREEKKLTGILKRILIFLAVIVIAMGSAEGVFAAGKGKCKNHEYNDPVFKWSSDCKSCKAVFVCKVCKKKKTKKCQITKKVKKKATTKKNGVITYKAEIYFEDEEWTEEKK